MTRLRLFLFAGALALLVVPFGLPRYVEQMRLAASLRRASMEERKGALFGAWYVEAAALAATIPENATVDVVMLTPEARDIAVLAGSALQPRDVRFFNGFESWRQRSRARFFHDDDAANSSAGPPPAPAAVVIAVDAGSQPHLKRVQPPR